MIEKDKKNYDKYDGKLPEQVEILKRPSSCDTH